MFIFLQIWFLICFSLAAGRPHTIFDMAFQEFVEPRVPSARIPGATPANTFPLVIMPKDFVPAVVAPPAFIYPDHLRLFSEGRGAIPIFKPLRNFPHIRFIPLISGIYVSEPNLRRPYTDDGEFKITKVKAPPSGFSPVHDTQIGQRKTEIKKPEKLSPEASPVIVRIPHFPESIGEDPFGLRDQGDTLAFSAPGGIVQSGQPHFSFGEFKNAFESPNLSLFPSSGVFKKEGDDGTEIIDA